MQVVAVTDPLELGFARQAMIGIRVTRRARAGRRRARRARRGRLRRGHRRLLRPARRGRSARATSTCSSCISEQDPHHRRRARAPRRSCTSSCASRPTRGASAERSYARALALARDRATDWTPRPPCPATSTPTSRSSAPASPGSGRPTTSPRPTRRCGSSCSRPRSPGSARPAATAAGARRCSRPRWTSSPACRLEPGAARWPSTARCAPPSTRSAGSPTAEGIDAHFAKGGTVVLARTGPSCGGPGPRSTHARARGATTCVLLDEAATAARLRATRRPRRDVHPRLRGDPPRAAGARPGRRRRAARRRDPRAHPRAPDRAGPRGAPPRHGARRGAWCARPRATRPASPASAARWCRSTR